MEFTIETNVLYEIFKTVKPFTGQDYRRPVLPVRIDPNKEKELYNGMA